jgi:hypothetical protein
VKHVTPGPLMLMAASLVLVVAACAGSTDAGSQDADSKAPADDQPSAIVSDDLPTPGTAPAADADGPAVIKIGQERFEIDLQAGNNGCARPESDVVAGGGFTEDADPSAPLGTKRTTGAYLTFAFSPPDSPFGGSHVVVNDYANDVEWWADAENRPSGLRPDQGLVIDWSDNGSVIIGTASFIDPVATRSAQLNDLPVEAVVGAFEIACGPRP